MYDATGIRIGAMLRHLRVEQKLTQQEAADYLTLQGFPAAQKCICAWENDDATPNAVQLLLLCQLYGVRDVLDCFMEAPGGSLHLNAAGRERAAEYVGLLLRDERYTERATGRQLGRRSIRLYELLAPDAANQRLCLDSYALLELEEGTPCSVSCAVRVRGKGLEPRIRDGAILYVETRSTLRDGDVGFFLLDGEVLCRVYSTKNGVELLPWDPGRPSIRPTPLDDLKTLGRVLNMPSGKRTRAKGK